MLLSQLIRKLQAEQKKYGDIPVHIHAPNPVQPDTIRDIATFSHRGQRAVCISTEEAQ